MALETEIRAYDNKREELESRYHGKFVVFYESDFIGPFDTLESASYAAVRWHNEARSFLIRRVGVDELQELADQVTRGNRHDEVDWGKPKGKEVW
jgi:hypothetical protein